MTHRSLTTWLKGKGRKRLSEELARYQKLGAIAAEIFGKPPLIWCSVPGRVEIVGNHTDHQNGCVLAGSIDLDMVGTASKTDTSAMTLYSIQDERTFCVDIDQLEPQPGERGTTEALMRGIVAGLHQRGLPIGGMQIALDSRIWPGLGLSSSAALEVLLISMMNELYGASPLPPKTIAIIAREAEVNYFGKPCGLMDQLICTLGGLQFIDFKDPENPQTRLVDFEFEPYQVSLAIIDSGDDHQNLTHAFASIAEDMQSVASYLGYPNCRDIQLTEIHTKLVALRKRFGDRAVMRTLHYLDENQRVHQCVTALGQSDLYDFMGFIKESGQSSWQWLQNAYPPHESQHQALALSLALAQQFLSKKPPSTWRIHGGGFAGSALVMMPKRVLPEFQAFFQQAFAKPCVYPISIRNQGVMVCHSLD